jgi:hypothetical protein
MEIEVPHFCMDDLSIQVANGHLVNVIRPVLKQQKADKFPSKGMIQCRSEGAEIYNKI